MNPSTIERPLPLARSGEAADLRSLEQRLKSDARRAVDIVLASPRDAVERPPELHVLHQS
jgi:hypothetical protein